MNTPHRFTSMHSMPGLLAALSILAMPFHAQADINATIRLERRSGSFSGSVYLNANGASAPTATYHRVESPNGLIFGNSSPDNAQSSSNLSFSALMNECTNGIWKLILNVGDPSEEQYGFSVSITGVSSNMFGDTAITNPAAYASVTTNQPLIEWSSTSLFPQVHIQVHNGVQPPEPGNWVNMVAPVNSWTPPSPVLGGNNIIYLAYQTNGFTGITITTPTNGSGTAVADTWNADADLRSYDFSYFDAPSSGGGCSDPFNAAVECPGLSWTTGGDYGGSGWFVQTYETSVGSSALQSDAPDYASSWIEATVQGPGTVTFDWALFADYSDSFEFESYDDGSGDDYDYFYYEGFDAYGWDSWSVTLASNDTYTFTWTFYNDDDSANDYDAAFLDNVVYTYTGSNSVSYEAELEINIQRTTQGAETRYYLFPSLSNLSPAPITTHRVESPTGKSSGEEFTASSQQYATLQDIVNEILAGDWKLDFNYGHGSEYQYTFTVTTNNLWINDLPPTLLLEPLDAATGVATNTDYAWLGPVGFNSLTVSVRNEEGGGSLGFSSLSPSAMSWTNGPALPEGTNSVSVYYTSNNFSGLTISVPVDGSSSPISSWGSTARLTSRGYSKFVATAGFVPMPVTILPPMVAGGGLGLSFISQSGAVHYIEWSTNLATGPWMPATNFPGDGTTNMITLPTTNPAAYFKVETQ